MCVYDLHSGLYFFNQIVEGLCYLGSESGPGAGRADGSVAGEGDGQTSGPVLAGLVLTHQPALREMHETHNFHKL